MKLYRTIFIIVTISLSMISIINGCKIANDIEDAHFKRLERIESPRTGIFTEYTGY